MTSTRRASACQPARAAARRRRGPSGALALAGLLSASGCGSPPPTQDLTLAYAGCRGVTPGPVCEVAPGDTLTVWGELPGEVSVGRGATLTRSAAVDGGTQLIIQLAEPLPEALDVAAGDAAFRLALRAAPSPDPLAGAMAVFTAGDLDAAASAFAAAADKAANESLRGRALSRLVRVRFRQGDRDGAVTTLADAVRAHAGAGELSRQIDDATMQVYLLDEARDYARARAVLDGLPRAAWLPADSLALLEYYDGVLAESTGDLRNAMRHFAAARQRATRLSLDGLHGAAQQMLAMTLQAAGRREDADAEFAALAGTDAPADCTDAELINNLAWNRLLALEAGESADNPAVLLDQAITAIRRECPTRSDLLGTALLNRALAALHSGDAAAAATDLATARASLDAPPHNLATWMLDIESRIALAGDRPADALGAMERLAGIADLGAEDGAYFRALAGQARALVLLERRDDALARYAEADAVLDRASLQLPVQAGRATFTARREAVTREHVALLVDAGRIDAAFDQARRARSRVLRTVRSADRLAGLSPALRARWDAAIADYVHERDALEVAASNDWQLAADDLARERQRREVARTRLAARLDDALALLAPGDASVDTLPPLAAGAMALLYHPAPGGWRDTDAGWIGLAKLDGQVSWQALDCVDEAAAASALGECLLTPFAGMIKDARTLRVLPMGPLREIDFHALPFAVDGAPAAPLLARLPVSYGLDLAAGTTERPASLTAMRQGLIIADPTGNLPAARREANQVRTSLEDTGGWSLAVLAGEAADTASLRRGMADADLLHYAGHAAFGGVSGWDSVLPLADGARFGVGDILALPAVPPLVVLSGCETGRGTSELTAESLGLAQAFVTAGADYVIAAARPVADETAARLVDGFYEAWTTGADPQESLRAAQLAMLETAGDEDWPSFRLLTR